DRGAYLRICAEMLDRFGSAPDLAAAQLTAWTCALAPGLEDSTARLVTISRRALADSPKDRSRLLTLGAVLYRAGRSEDAIRTLNESVKTWGKEDAVPEYLFLAMAHFRLGETEVANKYLARATRWTSQDTAVNAGANRLSRLELTILHQEAE